MHRRATGFGMLVALLILGPAGRSGAEWDWYAGNIGFYSARNASATLSEKVQQGVDTGLDWLVLSGHFREGIYVGLRDVIREEDLNAPRMEGGEDRRGDDTAWDAAWNTALFREPNRWTVECEIALSALDIDLHSPTPHLRFNLALVSGRTPDRRWTWSVTYGNPENPNRFGDLIFEASHLPEENPDE